MIANLLRWRPGRRGRARGGTALLALALLGLAACGDDDSGGDASASLESSSSSPGTEDSPRTVEIAMVDNAFEPTQVNVAEGETIRFVFHNNGAVVHDAIIGDQTAQEEHEEEMRDAEETTTSDTDDEMNGMDHGATNEESEGEAAITVEPGEQGEITHTFDSAGELLIGCHEPGHYNAGMKITLAIA